MLVIFSFLLGYFTCWLEWHGFNGTALLSGLSACGLLILRLVSGEVLRPFTRRLYRWSKKKSRLGRVFLWWTHYWHDHAGHHRACAFCAIPTPAGEPQARKDPGISGLS